MQSNQNNFDRQFFRAYMLFTDDKERTSFLLAMLGSLTECVGDETAMHSMEEALAVSQGVGAAIAPQLQVIQGKGIRTPRQESGMFLVKH